MYILYICVFLIIWVTDAYLFLFIASSVAMHTTSRPDRGSIVTGTHADSAGNEAVCIAASYQPCLELYNHLLAHFHLLSLWVKGIGWMQDCLCFFPSLVTSHREILSPLWKVYIRKSGWMSSKAVTILHPHSQGEPGKAVCAFHFFLMLVIFNFY